MNAARGLLTLLLVMAAGTAAGPAHASSSQESLFQDDAQLVLSGDAAREAGLNDLQALGADAVHSIVFWAKVAPRATSRRRPTGFVGSDPASYAPERWDKYDDLVRGARARGLEVLLSPASPIPSWASGCSSKRVTVRRTCKPNPTQFKRFVEALGHRYSGTYVDENQGVGVLPRVDRWSVWNEPNQGGWLTPQFAKVGGRTRPQSPAIYRNLVKAAAKGLRSSGHRSDELLLGETAPIGRVSGALSKRPMPPGAFLNATFCLDSRGRSLRGAISRALDCAGYRRLPITGLSHHPYTRGGSRPPTDRGSRTEITISSASRLKTIIKRAERKRRIPQRMKISYTEFGFQTNPPDDLFGVSLAAQARYLNQADWIAYRDKSVASVAQYELRDERATAAFQSGLRFLDGRPKPGFAAYRMPLWVSKRGSRHRIWGQVRPAADKARDEVEVQLQAPGEEDFSTVATTTLRGTKGFVDLNVARRSGAWRLRWTPPDGGPAITSRVAEGVGR
ncbi:MAG: hypothetical protein H0V81_05120 [Solirubrobacterales bacterium]|nr:hypothetical protein [Solirubrobacterales bacterium]